VIETDFAPEMVAVAQRRASQLGLDNVETRVLDAEKMDLDDDSIDGIICRWGYMLMLDPTSALRESRRVLKKGRRLALSVWGSPEDNPWVTVVGTTMTELGYPTAADPFGPGGIFSMAKHETIENMLEESGFSNIVIEDMAVPWTYSSFDEAWRFMTQLAGAIVALLRDLPADEIETLRTTLKRNLERFRTSQGLTLPGLTINAYAS
jgi:ubiquinone/menaquinone biosynthesis C-methylase UbiE